MELRKQTPEISMPCRDGPARTCSPVRAPFERQNSINIKLCIKKRVQKQQTSLYARVSGNSNGTAAFPCHSTNIPNEKKIQ